MQETQIKEMIKEQYGAAARGEGLGQSCCGTTSCCGGPTVEEAIGKGIGYSDEELESVPDGSNLGLGCGNPTAMAAIREGDTVLDLGSGAGFDCFLAAKKVGEQGRVIGVDMTADMVGKATRNAQKSGHENVDFRLGEIENLPVEDDTVDLIISNCVINLSPDKGQVFREAYRVLKPGGRVAVSDIVLLKALPPSVLASAQAYAVCVAGALMKDDYLQAIREAGFEDIEVVNETAFGPDYVKSIADPMLQQVMIEQTNVTVEDLREALDAVRSVNVRAKKPLRG